MDMLDWVHQWDDYEMFMYVRNDEDEKGIYMQVSRREKQQGAEQWDIVYDRKISDLLSGIEEPVGTDAWEERMLRTFLHQNPELVNHEKAYLAAYQGQSK